MIARSVSEDPCCQLCCVLRRYALLQSEKEIEGKLAPEILPQSDTIKKVCMVFLIVRKTLILETRENDGFYQHMN